MDNYSATGRATSYSELKIVGAQWQFCENIWKYLKETLLVENPIDFLHELNSKEATSKISAETILLVEQVGNTGIRREELEQIIEKKDSIVKLKEETERTPYKIVWQLSLAHYLKEENGRIYINRPNYQLEDNERKYLEGLIAGRSSKENPTSQRAVFKEIALRQLSEPYNVMGDKLVQWLGEATETSCYSLYDVINTLYSTSVTNKPTLWLLLLLSKEGGLTLDNWKTLAKKAAICPPMATTETWFETWFNAKYSWFIMALLVKQTADEKFILTDYGRRTIDMLIYNKNIYPIKLTAVLQELESHPMSQSSDYLFTALKKQLTQLSTKQWEEVLACCPEDVKVSQSLAQSTDQQSQLIDSEVSSISQPQKEESPSLPALLATLEVQAESLKKAISQTEDRKQLAWADSVIRGALKGVASSVGLESKDGEGLKLNVDDISNNIPAFKDKAPLAEIKQFHDTIKLIIPNIEKSVKDSGSHVVVVLSKALLDSVQLRLRKVVLNIDPPEEQSKKRLTRIRFCMANGSPSIKWTDDTHKLRNANFGENKPRQPKGI